MWDVVKAVNFIRQFMRQAHSFGFNLALGGGVLHNGYSHNDLDIVAVPRAVDDFGKTWDISSGARMLLETLGGDFNMTLHSEKVISIPGLDRTVFHLELGTHRAEHVDLIVIGLAGLAPAAGDPKLHAGEPDCNHIEVSAPGGGVRCMRKGCEGWFTT